MGLRFPRIAPSGSPVTQVRLAGFGYRGTEAFSVRYIMLSFPTLDYRTFLWKPSTWVSCCREKTSCCLGRILETRCPTSRGRWWSGGRVSRSTPACSGRRTTWTLPRPCGRTCRSSRALSSNGMRAMKNENGGPCYLWAMIPWYIVPRFRLGRFVICEEVSPPLRGAAT